MWFPTLISRSSRECWLYACSAAWRASPASLSASSNDFCHSGANERRWAGGCLVQGAQTISGLGTGHLFYTVCSCIAARIERVFPNWLTCPALPRSWYKFLHWLDGSFRLSIALWVIGWRCDVGCAPVDEEVGKFRGRRIEVPHRTIAHPVLQYDKIDLVGRWWAFALSCLVPCRWRLANQFCNQQLWEIVFLHTMQNPPLSAGMALQVLASIREVLLCWMADCPCSGDIL